MTSSKMLDPDADEAAATSPGEPLRLAVLTASVRADRIGRTLTDWAAGRADATGAVVDLIDLAECPLPSDDLLQPGGGPRSSIAERVERADGYVIVTPEYNHSYPATLKRAIDWHYAEWMFKAATVLSYGAQGGLLATEHLRGVFAELHVVTTRRAVGLRAPWEDVDEGEFVPPPGVDKAFDEALGELAWWADVLRSARRERPFQR
ncbi:NADPH-dependent FMN reductase [Geodermatophilus sp. DSM 44513]|uniref:NADPH-dependent FMN reductase n=1 Tax=Geodermatophilus sp. DSM 44513 TaxID=1528104 RepID=UPI001284597F|nr:NAD(P)H-dependent oxidoreductase [Geodermatophilus sp. DSM 44513]WNV75204.1 NAD(P)H-dependent oxidoreductase [Geodermatophilus sp. DSM 44513]